MTDAKQTNKNEESNTALINYAGHQEYIPANTYPKSVAISTFFSDGEKTLRKIKIINTITYVTRHSFFTKNPQFTSIDPRKITLEDVKRTDTTIAIDEDFFMQSLGLKKGAGTYYSFGQVLNIIESISDQKIYFDSLGIASKHGKQQDWTGFTRLIYGVKRENGFFKISLTPDMMHRIVNPEVSLNALLDMSNIKSKYTPQIMEICKFFKDKDMNNTEWYKLTDLRKLIGAELKSFDRFSKFNERILQPVINDINNEPQLNFTIETETKSDKTGRSSGRPRVSHIRFIMSDKKTFARNPEELKFLNELAIQKTELRTLGIAKNQITNVIDECRDHNNNIQLEFITWANRRGHDLLQLKTYKTMTHNEFGAVLRKQVIRDNKENWLLTNELLNQYLNNRHSIKPESDTFKHDKAVLNDRVKRDIVNKHLTQISEFSLAKIKDDFTTWLNNEITHLDIPTKNKYEELALTDYDNKMFYTLTIFFREEHDLFTPSAYEAALNEI